jgi:hypothetical protein
MIFPYDTTGHEPPSNSDSKLESPAGIMGRDLLFDQTVFGIYVFDSVQHHADETCGHLLSHLCRWIIGYL